MATTKQTTQSPPTETTTERSKSQTGRRVIIYLSPEHYHQLAWLAKARNERPWMVAAAVVESAMERSRQHTPAPPKK
jgi:phosphatidylserine decarboxylase